MPAEFAWRLDRDPLLIGEKELGSDASKEIGRQLQLANLFELGDFGDDALHAGPTGIVLQPLQKGTFTVRPVCH